MSDNVELLPASATMTPYQALSYVLKEDIEDVLILAYDKNGNFIVRSSHISRETALFLSELGAKHALNFEEEWVED